MQELFNKIVEQNSKLEGWCTDEKACRLAKAIIEAEGGTSVELGVFGGRGVIAMAMAHKHLKRGVAWGFDPWTTEAALEGENTPENAKWWSDLDLEAIYLKFIEAVHARGLFAHLYFARLRSDRAVTLFQDGELSLVHADSNHSEKVSCDEVNRWAPKLKVGGYWFADDIDWKSTLKAQELLVTKGFMLLEDYKSWAVYQKTKLI